MTEPNQYNREPQAAAASLDLPDQCPPGSTGEERPGVLPTENPVSDSPNQPSAGQLGPTSTEPVESPAAAGHWPPAADGSEEPTRPPGAAVTDAPTLPPITATYEDTRWPAVPGYVIVGELGKGGMGAVLKGRDSSLDREVAVKVLRETVQGNASVVQRFLAEAQISGQLQHPGTVPVYQLGTLGNNLPFFTMKLVEGQTLARLHKERPTPQQDLPRFVQIFEQICQAVAYAHSRGIIHRDLKPLNVMVGAFGEVQVMDWGLAKRIGIREESLSDKTLVSACGTDAVQTQAGAILGTPAYMSPEQARGEIEQLDARTDVFALGSILCEILTGKPAYEGLAAIDVLLRAAEADLADAYSRLDGCGADAELIALAKACLTVARDKRPRDAKAVADAVTAYLAGVQARLRAAEIERAAMAAKAEEAWARVTAERAKAQAERRARRLLAGLAAALLAGVAGAATLAAVAWRQWNAAEVARADAEEQRNQAFVARRAAEHSEATAKTEAATATAVKDFLQRDLFQLAALREQHEQVTTGITIDPELKVRELVVRAALKMEGKFRDQPLVEAEIRGTLGWTLQEIGQADLAATQWRRVCDLYLDTLGPDHANTLRSMTGLANSYASLGRQNAAVKLREEILARRQATLGPNHVETLWSMNNLAESYAALGRLGDALKLREETLARRRATLGPDHADTLVSMHNLAASYAVLGRNAAAMKLREETLSLLRAKWGAAYPDTLRCMAALAISYEAVGRQSDALKLREEAVTLMKANLGLNHPDTLTSMNDLALIYEDLGRPSEARKLYEELIVAEERFAAVHAENSALAVTAAGACCNLGNLLAEAHAPGDALAWFGRAASKLSAVLAKEPSHAKAKLYLHNTYLSRAETLDRLGRHTEAVHNWEAALNLHVAPMDETVIRGKLALSLAHTGEHLKAVAEAHALANAKDVTAGMLYDLACACAIASATVKDDAKLQEQYAARAVELLRQAVAKGYKDVDHLKKDDDLKPLQERDDYRKLLQTLEGNP